uniref:Uncharacterized protein n=1 Tax=Spironucleus salmonicida TaxID=348837 RepID=V6M3Q2_9EUKA|eukprot:EST47929.1 Hypothetical protein SS50377_11972 [Spironucleus salmonicida]
MAPQYATTCYLIIKHPQYQDGAVRSPSSYQTAAVNIYTVYGNTEECVLILAKTISSDSKE